MKELIRELVGNQAEAVSQLLTDPSAAPQMRGILADRLLENSHFVARSPTDQLLLILSRASFADSEDECVRVAKILCVRTRDVMPLITRHQGFELASRCLVTLALFNAALEARCRRRQAPPPSYYRAAGKTAFHRCNMDDLSSHFTNWEIYIGEFFS